ncbi:hypothetical protein BC941DRAFT_434360 [Chlamydoabsidia padenii]|nr:hypothetical protein BC941DRAFT_434360 [Chlamydoabsidia padenii]
MKDGFKSITIEPFNGYLDFLGPINPQQSSGNKVLKGDIHLELTKAINVKKATLKFIGSSRVCHQNTLDSVDVGTPILPKLKTSLFSSTTTLGPGLVILPWEMEILNIYPCSVMIKRISISYKIELTISLGLHRTVTAEYPIVIKRHMIPCLEVAPLVPTKFYTKTISTKFHYEIDAPRIVCIAQKSIPLAIKLLTIGTHKRVLSIRTQVIQVELCRCNTLPKTDADMTKFKFRQSTSGKKGESKYAKYTKRTTPAIIHTLDETQAMSSSQPLLIRHPLGEYLTLGMESPLAAIYHQLEITFQFGAKFEDIHAKVPILIVSAGPSQPIKTRGATNKQPPGSIPLALYPFEKIPVIEPILVMDEGRMDINNINIKNTNYSPSITRIPTPSSINTDVATMEGEEEVIQEVGDFTEMVADHPQGTGGDKSVSGINLNKETDSNLGTTTAPAQSLRRSRSALDISATTPIDNGHVDTSRNQLLHLPQHIRHQGQPTPSHNKSGAITNPSPIQSHQTQTLGKSLEVPYGMWPRLGTQVPQQWRRRSTSQPFPSIVNTPSRPLKDVKRNLNLTITPPSVIMNDKPTLKHVITNKRSHTHQDMPLRSVNDYHHHHLLQQQRQEFDMDDSPLSASESSGSTESILTSYMAENSVSGDSDKAPTYEPQSRPISPTFATAPGLPSTIFLRPQNANPVALLEETFVLSPGSLASTPVTSQHFNLAASSQHMASLQHTQGFARSNIGDGTRSSDILSITSSSVLDPDEDIMRMMRNMEIQHRRQREQQQSLEQHYTYAELPPLPSHRQTIIYYADSDDSDGESIDGRKMYGEDSDDTNYVYPSIATTPLPPPPTQHQLDEPVCLCPKHGIAVARR